jgi:hypothetical protein
MNKGKKVVSSGAVLAAGLLAATAAPADEAAPPPAEPLHGEQTGAPPAASPLIAPVILGPLTMAQPPTKFETGLGNVYLGGVGSGLFQWQNNVVPNVIPGSRAAQADLSNGQLFLQKSDGLLQFYVQGGAYSIASLGLPYISAAQATFGSDTPFGNLWGPFPMGFAKVAPTDNFSIQGGKLPTLIGAEYIFSFQNINIERGLLWNQEPAISKGAQANYTLGPVAMSLSFNDGFDSGVWSWLSGSATYTLDPANAFTFCFGANLGSTKLNTLRTPLLQNNSQIYNLVYTYNSDPWIIQPYFQATHVPTNTVIGIPSSASSFGAAVLTNYNFGNGVNLGGRVEYIGTTGNNNLLYGPGSGAFSATLTPAYQYKHFFARAEFSWVKANGTASGLAFGTSGNNTSQTRVLVETGILF